MNQQDLVIYTDNTLPTFVQSIITLAFYLNKEPSVSENQIMDLTHKFVSSDDDLNKAIEKFHIFIERLSKAKKNPASVSTDELDILATNVDELITEMLDILDESGNYYKDKKVVDDDLSLNDE